MSPGPITQPVTLLREASGFTYYQNWSLWDTYRTQAAVERAGFDLVVDLA